MADPEMAIHTQKLRSVARLIIRIAAALLIAYGVLQAVLAFTLTIPVRSQFAATGTEGVPPLDLFIAVASASFVVPGLLLLLFERWIIRTLVPGKPIR
ncbi:MAG: hypothetical protein RIB58_00920 [Phycisphaerales bacterium]